jgi:tryptophanyl-tRNA synthetase
VNKKYKDNIFKIPEPLIGKNGAKIYDLVNPEKKMSKSTENPKGVIYLMDDEKTIRKKIMSATTDSEMKVVFDPDNKPGISNLITIYSVLSNKNIKAVEKKFKDSNYGEFKRAVADLVVSVLIPIQEKYRKLIDSKKLDKILDEGRDKTSLIAYEKYDKLKKAVGLYR